MNQLVTQRTVLDLVDEYEDKKAAIETELKGFEESFTRLEMAASIQGKFVSPITRHRPHIHASELQKVLLKSGWKAIYDRLQIDMIASAKDKKLFERTLEDPPELTFDNAKATFGDYLMRPRYHILRGLAEVFADLDQAYKSHSKVKIGVKGLPKRVILSNYGGWGSYGRDKLRDIVNALAAYQGKPLMNHDELSAIAAAHDSGEDAVLDGRSIAWKSRYKEGEYTTLDRGLTIRGFSNGNAHIFFAPNTLLDINRALAEFYGEVLPDAEEEGAKPQESTAVSKDLQFYWSPPEVIAKAMDVAGIYMPRDYSRSEAPAYRVLEPSCGDGRILDELRARGCRPFGIEVHAGRAAEARAKGHPVLTGNFLEQPARPEFDFVVMNPPFYGRHYVQHVRHALNFLKPGGTLVSILPATAHYDHQELQGQWTDLPVGSFSEAGTNVPTGIIKIRKAAA
ncbi:DUF4942 domain-containing protein [Rhizobium favelukesii]|uniref:DUF4942 domain-containing protein n=1 Tax=Rhizobium favelukesii TaxID=348824 RepID=UPI00215F3F7F|nr:DUF4942 domain-containing protein [Rhizobium favelukesii]MCS0459510.1 DUF4942 domain-containing protein [Rhizobium favelukesii]